MQLTDAQIMTRKKIKMKLAIVTLIAAGLSQAATVDTFYSQADFDASIGNSPSTTLTFARNAIPTGLAITTCSTGGAHPVTSCSPALDKLFDRANITNESFNDVVGHLSGLSYSTTITLPTAVTYIGFSIGEGLPPTRTGSTFGVTLGDNGPQTQFPFGGVSGPYGLPDVGYSYTGFLGFSSDQPFDSVQFGTSYQDNNIFSLSSITYADPTSPTPEPRTAAIAGLGLAGVWMWRRKK